MPTDIAPSLNTSLTQSEAALSRSTEGRSLKALTLKALARVATGIPLRARRALIKSLAPDGDFAVVQALAGASGIQSVRVAGAYGLIDGSIHDYAILPRYARTKRWCQVENRFFIDFFEAAKGGTYLDIGANLGLTTIPVAQNPTVSCLAFEPEPSNFQYLSNNVARNCCAGNVQLLNLALFDRVGTLEFELSDRNMGDHRVRVASQLGVFDEQKRLVIRVQAEPLDRIVDRRSIRGPLAAKVIAQGAEAHIIKGGRAVLADAEVMVIEFYPYAMARLNADLFSLIDFMEEHFAEAAVIVGGSESRLVWEPVKTLSSTLFTLTSPGESSPYEYFHIFLRKGGAVAAA